MALRRAYAPLLPELDPFLFAAVGEEVDGIPLSVLSALSRLDLDPRDEAARLSHLPNEAAADQLARMIARLPGRRWTAAETGRIAIRLIELLPRQPSPARASRSMPTPTVRQARIPAFLIYLALALLGAALIGLVARKASSMAWRTPSSGV